MFQDAFASIIEQDFAIAYLKLLGQMYYKQITVTMLVETAGYGRATFYAYFSGLRDLRHRLSAYDLETTERIYRTALSIDDNEERKKFLISDLIPHVKLFWPLMHENNMPDHMENMKVSMFNLFENEFKSRFDNSKYNAAIVESFCVSGTLHMMTKHFERGDDVKAPETIDGMIDFMNYILFYNLDINREDLRGS